MPIQAGLMMPYFRLSSAYSGWFVSARRLIRPVFETGVVVGPRGLEFEYQQTWAHQFWDSSVQHESQT